MMQRMNPPLSLLRNSSRVRIAATAEAMSGSLLIWALKYSTSSVKTQRNVVNICATDHKIWAEVWNWTQLTFFVHPEHLKESLTAAVCGVRTNHGGCLRNSVSPPFFDTCQSCWLRDAAACLQKTITHKIIVFKSIVSVTILAVLPQKYARVCLESFVVTIRWVALG